MSGTRILILPLLLLLGGGCVTLPERVARNVPAGSCGTTCQLGVAKDYASRTEAAMLGYLKHQRRGRDILRGVTFVGALGTAAATSFGGGRDLTVALGLGTGTAAITSSLTVDRGYAGTYLAAADASACVAGAIDVAGAASVGVDGHSAQLQEFKQGLDALAGLSAADEKKKQAAMAKADAALVRAKEFEIAGNSFAIRTISAVDDIVVKARQQIAAQEPDRAAFADALSAVGALAVQPKVDEPGPAASNDKGDSGAPGRGPASATESPELERQKLLAMSAGIDRAAAAIEIAIGQSNSDAPARLAGCAGLQTVAAVQPLAVSGATNDAVTISKGSIVSLRLTGGDVGYRATWIGEVPKDVTLSQQGDTIDVSAGSTLVTGKTYTLRIRDLATKSQSKDISVTTG